MIYRRSHMVIGVCFGRLKFLLVSNQKDVKISFTEQSSLKYVSERVSCRWMWEETKPLLLVEMSVRQRESSTGHLDTA
jgi:hypothetical protein